MTQPSDLLTPRQSQILGALHSYIEEHGYPPSIRDIGDVVGLYSSASVARHLIELEARGYIRREPGKPRALTILSPSPDEQMKEPTS